MLTVLLALTVILIPLVLLSMRAFQEVISVYGALTQHDSTLATNADYFTGVIEQQVRVFIPSFQLKLSISAYLESGLHWIVTNLNFLFTGIFSFTLQCFIIVVAMFFLYRDGQKMHDFAIKWSPLADTYDETIIGKLELAVSSVVKGSLVTAIIQGALVGIGFAAFGVPNPVLWGLVSTIAALVPVLGTAIVILPAAFYFLFAHQLVPGIGLIIWWVISVGIVEHVTRPLLIKRDIDIHPFLILLSVLGGLVYFGPIGFLSGPIVLAFFFALLNIYPEIIKGQTIKDDGTLLS